MLARLRHGISIALLAASVTLVAASAGAEPASADAKAAAEALFEEGKELKSQGKCDEAIPKFEQSLQLDPGIGTLLRLADCFEEVGHFASAWANFRHAASLAKQQDDERRAELADERAAALEPKLTRLAIDFGDNTAIPGLIVRRGTVELGRAMNRVALPVDAGTYQIEASAPGYRARRLTVKVAPGDAQQTVALPRLEALPQPRVVPLPPPVPPPVTEEQVVVRYGQRVAALVLGVGSVATGVAAAVLAGSAAALDEDADTHCDGVACRDRVGVELSEDALERANLATAGFVVAGAAGAGALILFLTAPPLYETVTVTPSATPTSAGLEVRWRW